MSRVAFDIVLLLPSHIKEEVIKTNQGCCLKNHPISFSDGSRSPHISLAMGVIEKDKLAFVQKTLEKEAGETKPLTLQISRQYNESIPTGETVLGFEIKPTDSLKLIHEAIMEKLETHISHDASLSEVFDLDPEPQTINWVNGFKENSSGTKFWPHITVGIGGAKCLFPTELFTVLELAMFHIGTYCTCPKDGQLGKWDLHG